MNFRTQPKHIQIGQKIQTMFTAVGDETGLSAIADKHGGFVSQMKRHSENNRPETAFFRPTVVRTDRGLSIAGTRITLYQIMDYIKDNTPPEVIRDDFRLTIRQTDDVMDYIRTHYDEVEEEYQRIVRQADEIRQYWSERNRERFAEIARRPEYQKTRARLDEWRAKLRQDESHTGAC